MGKQVDGAFKHPERFAVSIRHCERKRLVAAIRVMLSLPSTRPGTGISRCTFHIFSYKNSLRWAGFLLVFSGIILCPEHIRLVQQSLIDAFLDDPGVDTAALQVSVHSVVVLRRFRKLQLLRVRMLLRWSNR